MKRTRKITAILIAVMMLTVFVPTSAMAADVGIQNGTGTITSYTTTIGYGGHEWVVIGQDETYGAATGSATLLHKNGCTCGGFDDSVFDDDSNRDPAKSAYDGSVLHNVMLDIYDGFSNDKEKALIDSRELDGVWNGTDTFRSTDTLAAQYVWALSGGERLTLVTASPQMVYYSASWWLRSPRATDYASSTTNYASPLDISLPVYSQSAVRPALNLNLTSVIFTSAASGANVKSTAVGGLTEAHPPTIGEPIKFTMKDASQTLDLIATAAQTTQSGVADIEFSYANATTGANQYVSCVIEGTSGADNGVVKYYGKLSDSSSAASGKLSIPLTGVANGTYTLKIFSEEANTYNYTDFCSEPLTMTLIVSGGNGTVSNLDSKIKILEDDAGLATVAGTAITAGSEAGTSTSPKTDSITVANAKDVIEIADVIASDTNAAVNIYSDSGFSLNEDVDIPLTVGNSNHVYVKVTAENNIDILYYDITVARSAVPVASITIDGGTSITNNGGTLQLSEIVLPANATDKSVTWSSSNTNIATVDGSGLVTAIADGDVIITATSNENSSIKGTKTIRVTGQTTPVPPSPVQYKALDDFGKYTGSETISAKVDADANEFVRLTNKGNAIDKKHYTIASGSTIITFNESFLKTLANGTYSFRAEFTNGYADLTLVVAVDNATDGGNVPKKSDDTPKGNAPKTGDDTQVGVLISLIVLSGVTLTVLILRRKMVKD